MRKCPNEETGTHTQREKQKSRHMELLRELMMAPELTLQIKGN